MQEHFVHLLAEIGNTRKSAKWSFALFAVGGVWTLLLIVLDWSWLLVPGNGWLAQVWTFRAWPALLMLIVGIVGLFWTAPLWTSRLGQRILRKASSSPAILVWLVIVALASVVSLARTGLLPAFLWRTVSLDSGQIVAEGRFAYQAPIPPVLSGEDAPTRITENGHILGPAGAVPDSIRASGFGRYSVLADRLLFSTSDNSNPLRNKRRYSIQAPGLLVTPETESALWLLTFGLG